MKSRRTILVAVGGEVHGAADVASDGMDGDRNLTIGQVGPED